MITPAYAKEMARYNAWQNRQLSNVVQTLDEASLTQDRGAFFGSILGTLNHLLWCDQLWSFAAPVTPGFWREGNAIMPFLSGRRGWSSQGWMGI